MVDHRGPCARQRVVVEHDLVALPFRIGEAPGPRDLAREDGDHGYYAACAAVPGSGAFYRRRFELLALGAAGAVEPSISAPRRLDETTTL